MDRKTRKPTKIHLVVDRSLDSDIPNGVERRGQGSRPIDSRERRVSRGDTQEPRTFKLNISYLIYGCVIALALAAGFVQHGNAVECEADGGRYMKEFLQVGYECVK